MKKRDIQIIIILTVVAVLSFIAIKTIGQGDSTDSYVNIYVGDVEYERVSLDEPQTVVIDIDDRYNEIEINSKGTFMKDSNCENQDCLHQGEVTLDNLDTRVMGGWIVCLPNQISIELVKGESL